MIDTKAVILAQKVMLLMPKFRRLSHVAVPEGRLITLHVKLAFDAAVEPLISQLALARGTLFAKLD
jgi:hypothetical protein